MTRLDPIDACLPPGSCLASKNPERLWESVTPAISLTGAKRREGNSAAFFAAGRPRAAALCPPQNRQEFPEFPEFPEPPSGSDWIPIGYVSLSGSL